ncbi:Rhomboid- protein 3 [Tritrichomonas musculus]|uniref:Rhomboid- protein 3 n=1 Tax=Tritrichomonas musculus TaxID=1915356 RepID=A0ABR2J2C4_9EUKA
MTIVKNVEFNDEMQQFAINAGQQAVDRLNMTKNIAQYILSEMKKKYDHEWHCFVTDSLDEPKDLNNYDSYICFKIELYTVHLWDEHIEKQASINQSSKGPVPLDDSQPLEKLQTLSNNNDKKDIKALFAKYDKSGDGKLEFDEFIGFMHEGLGFEGNINQMRFLYDGMDTNGSHNIDQSEIIECLINWKEGNFKWITKMIFRGADKDKSRKVSINELKCACSNLGKSLDQEDFEKQCISEFGSKKKELEYWEFYKIISGETLDKNSIDADPYDGKIPQKSKCCLLL